MLEFLLKSGWYNWLCKSAPTTSRRPTIELLFLYFSIICIFQDQTYIHFVWQPCLVVDGCSMLMLHRKPLADQNCSAIINNHLPTIVNHPENAYVFGGRREVVDVIFWQPVTDHRQTFADLRQPSASTPKIVVTRGRGLVVAIMWPSLIRHSAL